MANLLLKIVVDDVFHVNCIKIICPWVENLEALVLDSLLSISFDIVFEMLESCLVSLDWVAEIILIDSLLVVSQEPSNCLDARCRLEVLTVN